MVCLTVTTGCPEPDPCGDNGRCINGSDDEPYYCTCDPGWVGLTCRKGIMVL